VTSWASSGEMSQPRRPPRSQSTRCVSTGFSPRGCGLEEGLWRPQPVGRPDVRAGLDRSAAPGAQVWWVQTRTGMSLVSGFIGRA
jgi:hypothetical protein